MQKRCPAAWQTNNEQRFADFLFRDFGITLAIPREQQSIAQNSHDIILEREFSDYVQLRFAMAGFQ
jgi:hypothetical protein